MKKLNYALLAAAPAVLMTRPAQAQDKSKPYSVRLGYSRLTDSDSRDTLGSGLLLGASYSIPRPNLPFEGRVDLDYTRASRDGDRSHSLGLGYTALWRLNGKGTPAGLYGGVGVGVYRVSVRAEGRGGNGNGGGSNPGGSNPVRLADLNDGDGVDAGGTKLGAKMVLGYNFGERFYGEAVYHKIGKVDGADPSQMMLTMGVRF